VVKDRFGGYSVASPNGALSEYAVPYATRVRTWEKDSRVLATEETTDWDATNLGWKVSHRTKSITSNPSLPLELRCLQSRGLAFTSPGASLGIEEQTTKVLDSKVPEWLFNRVSKETVSRSADNTGFGVNLTSAQPPVSKVQDPVFNTLKSATVGDASGSYVTTTFGYQGSTGVAAALISNVALNGSADLAKAGTEGISAYGYDANHFMNSISQKPNASITLEVKQSQDEIGRPLTQTDSDGRITQITWDAVGRLSSITPPGEVATTITYDDSTYRGITLTRGAQVQEFRYNGFGELVLERKQAPDGLWSHKIYGFASNGHKTGETVWMPGQGIDHETAWKEPNLVETITYTYTTPEETACTLYSKEVDPITGERECLRWKTYPATTTTRTLTAISSGLKIKYDGRSRVSQIKDANGLVTLTEYPVSTSLPPGIASAPGSQKKVIVGFGSAIAQSTWFQSDAQGRLVRVVDALNQKTEYKYDGADRIARVEQYDASARVQTRTWSYNALGWLNSLLQPESGTTTYSSFTILGKPRVTSYAGRVLNATYDALGRPVTLAGADGTVAQSFTYDAANGKGKLAKSVDGSITLNYAYAAATGQLATLKTTALGTDLTQSFGYDTYGNRTSGNTSHAVWTQTYHAAVGLPNLLKYGTTTVANTPWSNYDPLSWMPTRITYGNGVASLFSYGEDQARLAGITHSPATGSPRAQWTYSYDAVGNLVKETDVLTGKFDQYSYDALNRLLSASIQSTTFGSVLQNFAYDAFGNRVSGTTSANVPTTSNVTLNAGSASLYQKNQIPTTTASGALTGALYDAQGNLTQIYEKPGDTNTLVTLTYDALARVKTVFSARTGITESYQYTAEGLRTVIDEYKSGALQKTRVHLYNDARQLVSQYEKTPTGALTWKRDIVYSGDREAAEFDAAGMHVTQVDHLGSPRIVTNASGTVESTQKYLPFGELLEQTGAVKTAKGFTGHEQTDASRLIYMQARFYVPWCGRFASPDPARDQHFEETQSWNIYSYVRNCPVMKVDPTGMIVPRDPNDFAKRSDGTTVGIQQGMNNDDVGGVGVVQGVEKKKAEQSRFERFKEWLKELRPGWANLEPVKQPAMEQTLGIKDGGIESDRDAARVVEGNHSGEEAARKTGLKAVEDYGPIVLPAGEVKKAVDATLLVVKAVDSIHSKDKKKAREVVLEAAKRSLLKRSPAGVKKVGGAVDSVVDKTLKATTLMEDLNQ